MSIELFFLLLGAAWLTSMLTVGWAFCKLLDWVIGDDDD